VYQIVPQSTEIYCKVAVAVASEVFVGKVVWSGSSSQWWRGALQGVCPAVLSAEYSVPCSHRKLHCTWQIYLFVTNDYVKMAFTFGMNKSLDEVI